MRRRSAAAGVLALAVTIAPPPASAAPGEDCFRSTTFYDGPVWHREALDFERVWEFTEGAGIQIAVLDTGVEAVHPQFSRGAIAGGNSIVASPFSPLQDCAAHGTAVAGLIAARPLGGTDVVGIAPAATIVPIRVSNDPEEGSEADLAAGVREAVLRGVDVINVSITTGLPDTICPAVASAVEAGVVVVAASGNQGDDSQASYPAECPGVIAVGATEQNEDGGQSAASFSQISEAVSVAAPGAGVWTTYPDTNHANPDGTSFAAPLVSGTVALMLDVHPDLTPEQVRHRLEVTADRPPGPLPDERLGYGVINPYQAVTAVLPEESGAAPQVEVGPVPPVTESPPPNHTQRNRALLVGVIGAVGALGILIFAAATRRAGPRSWRPGSPPRRVPNS